ncbi:MAG: Fe-S cluster assembly ATPase SufC [Bacilli bacterium]|nr:Fe-S cluster assembly ATPase SufC [Bacilli bacterium]
MHTLKIKNICVEIDNKEILKDFSLEIKSGEIHAIMGPNGTGKSTLSRVIMGDSRYTLTKGEILFDDKNINNLTTDERARLGLFLGLQMPTSIEGVTNADFLRTALHIKEGEKFNLMHLIKDINKSCEELKMNKDMIHRAVNSGFSGGERKKNEILQMKLLKPSIIMLDEIDSGLDVDSLKIVGENVMDYYKNSDSAILLITHYQRLLDYIKPDFVHIMINGNIKVSGDASLVDEIESKGYEKILSELEDKHE